MLILCAHERQQADLCVQWEHASAGTISEVEGGRNKRWGGCHRSLHGWRDASLAVRPVATRRGCAPRAPYVRHHAQLMSYLGRSTLGSVCKGEKSVREGWHDHSNHRTNFKKSGIGMVIKEMLRSETLYLVELTQSELKRVWEWAALKVWIYVNDLLCIRRVFSHGIKGIVKLTLESLTWRIYHLWKWEWSWFPACTSVVAPL